MKSLRSENALSRDKGAERTRTAVPPLSSSYLYEPLTSRVAGYFVAVGEGVWAEVDPDGQVTGYQYTTTKTQAA